MSFDLSDLRFLPGDMVSQGGQRCVYAHDAFPHLVFKKQKSLSEMELKKDIKSWSLRRFPSLVHHIVRKEYHAYVTACLSTTADLDMIPVSKMFGFSPSNIGLVQIAEKVTLDGNTIGPTLSQLHQSGGLTPERCDLLTDFARLLRDFNIPTNDVSARNVVLGLRRGVEKFICVDGFGDIHLIPVRTYSRRIRRDALAQRMQKMARSLDLSFDRQSFSFAPL